MVGKTVMILGAGRGQLPLIDICKAAGYELIVVSPAGDYPGFKYADRYYLNNVLEKEAILEIAQAEKIDAIITDQLDAGVLTAAYVAGKMNLPGIGCNVAEKFTNKLVMRKEAEALGVAVPQYRGVKNIQEACDAAQAIGYPVIIKPADSSASRGVFKIYNQAELIEHFGESLLYSRINTVLVEQTIIGKAYAVQSFTRDYQTSNLIIGHRDFFNFPNLFIPCRTLYIDANSALSDAEKNILAVHQKLVTGYGLDFGIAYGEYLYNENADQVYLVEIAARGAATYTSSDLIPLACGVNPTRLLVESALGITTSNEPIQLKPGASAYLCFTLPEGRVVNIENADKVENIAGVYKAIFDNVWIGMEIPKVTDKSSRKGPILVYGKNKQDCYDAIDKVKQVLKIEVETPGGGIQGIQW